MTPEEKALLEKTAKLTEENHAILVSLRRSHRISTALTALYWIVIILLTVGSLYLVQPYFNMVKGLAGSVGSDATTVSKLQSTLNGLLQQ